MGNLPMFKEELPLVEQVMVNYGNTIEPSPIVHPEIAGRGVECAHGRAAWKCSSQCQGVLADMKMLVMCACNKTTQPQALMCKCERRTRDYTRSHRMGTSSKDLEKMRCEIKTHRNMLDYHTNFVRSERADDATDTTLLGYDATLKILPQNKSSRSLTVPVFPADADSSCPVLVGPHDDHACDPATRSVCSCTMNKCVSRSYKVMKRLIIQRGNRVRVARLRRFQGPILLLQ
jgi:hypothetical protein